jgi:hypothetical protein
LHEFIQKGFASDDERLKQGGSRYFRELLQRIRDIRSSWRNFYQQLTDIYATATDSDPRSDMTKHFFAIVQNKLHYAVHEHAAAELIHERVDSEKPLVGMTNFKGDYITKDDVKIAKNYLFEIELQRLNLLVSGFLDYAEYQALSLRSMSMGEWITYLDHQIVSTQSQVLIGKGKPDFDIFETHFRVPLWQRCGFAGIESPNARIHGFLIISPESRYDILLPQFLPSPL